MKPIIYQGLFFPLSNSVVRYTQNLKARIERFKNPNYWASRNTKHWRDIADISIRSALLLLLGGIVLAASYKDLVILGIISAPHTLPMIVGIAVSIVSIYIAIDLCLTALGLVISLGQALYARFSDKKLDLGNSSEQPPIYNWLTKSVDWLLSPLQTPAIDSDPEPLSLNGLNYFLGLLAGQKRLQLSAIVGWFFSLLSRRTSVLPAPEPNIGLAPPEEPISKEGAPRASLD